MQPPAVLHADYAKEQTRRQSLADSVSTSQKSLDLARSLYTSGLTDFNSSSSTGSQALFRPCISVGIS
jgi:hypothetical protein